MCCFVKMESEGAKQETSALYVVRIFSPGIVEHIPTPCLSTAYINMPVPDEITRVFPIMSLLGKRKEGGTL